MNCKDWTIENLEKENDELRDEIASKDRDIVDLGAQVEKAEDGIKEMEDKLDDNEKALDELRDSVKELEKQVKALTDEYDTLSTEYDRLQELLELDPIKKLSVIMKEEA